MGTEKIDDEVREWRHCHHKTEVVDREIYAGEGRTGRQWTRISKLDTQLSRAGSDSFCNRKESSLN